jgi:hypothetical protein
MSHGFTRKDTERGLEFLELFGFKNDIISIGY